MEIFVGETFQTFLQSFFAEIYKFASFKNLQMFLTVIYLTRYTRWKYLFTPHENIRKPESFLMFSGGIDQQHQVVMG